MYIDGSLIEDCFSKKNIKKKLSSELQDWVKDIKNESEILAFKELICVKLNYIDCFF